MRQEMQAGSYRLLGGACVFSDTRIIEGVEDFGEVHGIPSYFLLPTYLYLFVSIGQFTLP